MGEISVIAIFGLAIKLGICISAVVAVASAYNWYHKKDFTKKGGAMRENESRSPKSFHR